MRKTVAGFLFVALVAQACTPSRDSGANLELSALEDTSTRSNSSMELEEGQAGTKDSDRAEGHYKIKSEPADPQLARQQSIEHARNAGILGSLGGRRGIAPGPGPATPYQFDDDGALRGPTWQGAPNAEPATPSPLNAWTSTDEDRSSTFAADVDTASYTFGRRTLVEGMLPDPASVRVEEYLNYFTYDYPAPAADQPFAVAMDMAPSPFAATRQILRVGVSTRALAPAERKIANLVFLVDVSGSMDGPDRLGLVKQSLRVLVNSLQPNDSIALVTYAGSTEVVLPATSVKNKARIEDAIGSLVSGGGTAMGDGVKLAYAEAMKGLRPGALSRVIVLSDGDANIGLTSHEEILASVAGKVKEGVTLSTIGFGVGNYRDEAMEQLANKGNGNNYYIDGIDQAKRVFRDQVAATLEVVAKDVKLQVDFDPTRVARYRLIGYENRDIRDQDFRQDRVDAGEIGAGHQVTAMYELELTAARSQAPLATVRVRHKAPMGTTATEAAFAMPASAIASSFATASSDLRFAFAAAAFADVLRGSHDAADWELATIQTLAASAAGTDEDRRQLVGLIQRAIGLRERS